MTNDTHAGGHAGHMPSSGRGLAISAWLTGVYFFIEMGIGLWTGSIAVISDAFHTFSAVGGVLVAIVAARLARRPADEHRSFGWYRAEIIGALVNGGFLLGMALVVVVMGAMRLASPIDLPTGPHRRRRRTADRARLADADLEGKPQRPQRQGGAVAHPSDVRRQPDHHRRRARHPIHGLPAHRSIARHGVRVRAALGQRRHSARLGC